MFLCCNSAHKVALDHVCDGYDDCPRDKSDQYLTACYDDSLSEMYSNELVCIDPSKPYSDEWGYEFLRLEESNLNDSVSECLFDIDETCAWKNTLYKWV